MKPNGGIWDGLRRSPFKFSLEGIMLDPQGAIGRGCAAACPNNRLHGHHPVYNLNVSARCFYMRKRGFPNNAVFGQKTVDPRNQCFMTKPIIAEKTTY
jgi:hypothetical protein